MTRFIRRTVVVLALICVNPPAQATFKFDPATKTLSGTGYMPPIWEGGAGWNASQVCRVQILVDGQYYVKFWDGAAEPNCRYDPREKTLQWMLDQIAGGLVLNPAGSGGPANYIDIGYLTGEAGSSWYSHGTDIQSWTATICTADGPINLVHGVLPENTAVGHMVKNSVAIKCNGEADVKLTITPSNTKMTNGMTSRILVQGKSSKKIKVGEGETTIDITSELSGKPKQPGGATGSSVLQLEVQ